MGDGELQGDIGIRQDRNPLVGMNRSTIVEVRAHVDLLDADVSEPIRDEARHLTTPAPRRGLGIAAPDKDGVGVLGDILDDVVGNGLHADGIHAPDMLGTPIPALPGVWLTSLLQKAARERQQVGLATMRRVNGLGLSMAIGLRVDGERAAFVLNPLDLGNDVASLIPGDALVLGNATVLRIALTVGIPIDALQGVRNAILGVGAHLVCSGQRWRAACHARLQHMPISFDLPIVQVFGFVELVIVQRPDASDSSVLHIDLSDVCTHSKPAESDALDH